MSHLGGRCPTLDDPWCRVHADQDFASVAEVRPGIAMVGVDRNRKLTAGPGGR
ncbi:hypothetical protein ACFYYN_10615 [Streptomyces sp. NPDC001902]